MRFVATVLVLAVALMVPAPSSAKVKTVRKMSKVYNRARRDLRSTNDNTSKIRIRSETAIPKDGETVAPKPPTPSTKAPSKAPIVASEVPTMIPTVSPTTSPTRYMVKVPISMKLVLNGICECSPEVTEYLTSYVVDTFEGRFLGVSLMAKSSESECVGSCAAADSNSNSRTRTLKKNRLRFLVEDDKLELSIEGYQVVRPGEEKNLIDSVVGNTAMNNALASQIEWLAKDSGLPISSGSIAVMVEVSSTASPSLSPSVSSPLPAIDRTTSTTPTTKTKQSWDASATVILSVAFTLVGGLLLACYAKGRRSAESPRAESGNVIVRDIDEEEYAEVNSDKNADEVGSHPVTEANEEGFDYVVHTPLDIENPDVAGGEHILKEKEAAEEEDILAVDNVSPVERVAPADDEISNHSAGPEGEEDEIVDLNTGVFSQVVEVNKSTEVTPAAVTDEVDGMLEEGDEMVRRDDSSTSFVENDFEEGADATRNSNNRNDGTVTLPPAIDREKSGFKW